MHEIVMTSHRPATFETSRAPRATEPGVAPSELPVDGPRKLALESTQWSSFIRVMKPRRCRVIARFVCVRTQSTTGAIEAAAT